MATKKVTKNERYEQLLAIPAVAENEALVAFIKHEQELLNRKNTSNGEKKLTTQQTENLNLKEQIVDVLTANGKQTISQLIPQLNAEGAITHGRVVALLTQLRNENLVEREKVGKETYFKVVG
jgi:hypothetical protein